MKNFFNMNLSELLQEKGRLLNQHEVYKNLNLKLDMSRGIPSTEQIELSNKLLDNIDSSSQCLSKEGKDCRNYGGAYGIKEVRRLFAAMMEVDEDEVIVRGNSSLQLMFDIVSMFMTHGTKNCKPWLQQGKIKFLCPSPGYDRHFKISEYFNMELINVKMTPNGPDMDTIEDLVKKDESIKGIWCVPKYSNPQGIVYSDETVKRLASIKPLARDFRIFWDNAYIVHDLTDKPYNIINIMQECRKHNNENLPIIFSSMSKITFAGAGIAAVACTGENLEMLKKRYTIQSVGPDKLNQLRHVRFLKDINDIKDHMKKHRQILAPKFKIVIDTLKVNFSENPILKWTEPKGGYFVSVEVMEGCAKRIVDLCKDAGIILTDAGATFPYGIDPKDSNIRIAPSFPTVDDLTKAMAVFCNSAKLACVEKLINSLQ